MSKKSNFKKVVIDSQYDSINKQRGKKAKAQLSVQAAREIKQAITNAREDYKYNYT